jgi:hypothetical protein
VEASYHDSDRFGFDLLIEYFLLACSTEIVASCAISGTVEEPPVIAADVANLLSAAVDGFLYPKDVAASPAR